MKDILMSETGPAPCEHCPLEASRAVAARGPVPARLLLLAGAPRSHEERAGVAFASPAFAWLEQTLAAAGLDPGAIPRRGGTAGCGRRRRGPTGHTCHAC